MTEPVTPRQSPAVRGSRARTADREKAAKKADRIPHTRKTILLKDGSRIVLAMDSNPIDLDPADREFVFRLIDLFREYGQRDAPDPQPPTE